MYYLLCKLHWSTLGSTLNQWMYTHVQSEQLSNINKLEVNSKIENTYVVNIIIMYHHYYHTVRASCKTIAYLYVCTLVNPWLVEEKHHNRNYYVMNRI